MDVCYRHPDRETGVSCSSCGRPICPDCMTPTPVGMRCPECSKQRTQARSIPSARSDQPTLTYILIGICVAIALGTFLSGSGDVAVTSAGGPLLRDGGVNAPAIADGELWRLVTSGFLHFGPGHLLFNMLSLWILGSMLEPDLGRLRFGLVYFVSLLAGSFGALLLSPDANTAGASGAVFGLFGAAVVILRNRGIGLMESGLGIWLGLNLLLSLRPGVSLGGHLGGFAGGLLVAWILVELPRLRRLPSRAPVALAAAVGVLAVAGSVAVSV